MNFRTTLFMLVLGAAIGALVWFGAKAEPPSSASKDAVWTDPKTRKAVEPFVEKLKRIEVSHGAEKIVFEKEEVGKGWKITSPIHEAADGPAIDKLKSAIDFAKRQDTLKQGDPKINMKEFGLDPPKVVLSLTGDGIDHTLRIGAQLVTRKSCYAQTEEGADVLVLPNEVYDAVAEKKLADFREKNLFKYDEFDVDRVTVSQAGHDVELAKQDSVWKVVRPVTDRADALAVGDLLKTGRDLQAKEFVEDGAKEFKKYGLDVPSVKVSVVPHGESTAQTVLIGCPKARDKTKVYARRENSDNVVTVEANDAEKLKRTLDDLRDRKVFGFDDNEVTKVTISRVAKGRPAVGGRFLDAMYRAMGYVRREPIVEVSRPGGSSDWMMDEPRGYPFDMLSVSSWLKDLLDKTKVVEFRDAERPDGPPYLRGSEAELWLELERRSFGTASAERLVFPIIPVDATHCVTWRPNEDRVLGIDPAVRTQLLRGPLNFRRKSFLGVQKEQVSELTVQQGAESVHLQAVLTPQQDWKVLSPSNGSIDPVSLGIVLERIQDLVAQRFVEEGKGDDASFGFDKPKAVVSVTYGSAMEERAQGPQQKVTVTLTIGIKGEHGYHARFEAPEIPYTPVVLDLDDATVTDLTRRIVK